MAILSHEDGLSDPVLIKMVAEGKHSQCWASMLRMLMYACDKPGAMV